MICRFEEIDENEKRRLCDFMLAQRVSLFLGSGVSLDSIGPDGEMFSAGRLREELVALNKLPSNATLQKAYSALSDEQVEKHITQHYTCTEPGPTIVRLAKQPWRRIYSLNVDNCFESAFASVVEAHEFSSSSTETINFDDGFTELLSDKRASIIHLHGCVDRAETGYVFSQNEYAKSITRPNSWMLTLSQLIRTETFIVAGTSFDEIDVEYYLEQRSQKTIRGDIPPSVLIEPYPTKLTEMLCENHQFCLFEGTVLDFFSRIESIDDRLRMPWLDNESDGLSGLDLSESERLRFSANFHRPPDDPQKIPNPGRFLLGAELDWSMLAANSDISREAFSEVRRDVVIAADDPQLKLILLVDEPGSGKTAFLKRLAFDLSRGSDEVFWYDGLGLELEPREIASILNGISGRIFVFVDNFADCLNSISLILGKIEKPDILFVCCERNYRLKYIQNAFTGFDYPTISDRLKLTRGEARALRAANEEHGLSTIPETSENFYLGQVVGGTMAEANCRIQNNFKTLDRIVQDLRSECDQDEGFAYLLVALARFCYANGVRRSVLSTVSVPDAVEHLLSDQSSLPLSYSDLGNSFVVPKQAIVGDRFLDLTRRNWHRQLFEAFLELAKSVAPRVNAKTIKHKTPEAQLLGRLMDYDNNVRDYIDEYAEEYYAGLKPMCDWNARYWEQLALLKLDRFYSSPEDSLLLEESIQHARSAISAEVHPFSLSTLAKVLFQAMEKSQKNRDQYFSEAWQNVVDANVRESRWSNRGATLFTIAFGGVLKFLEMGGQLSGEQSEYLRDMIAETRTLKIADKRLIGVRSKLEEALG
ncbi:Hypothetical protein RAK1035_2361 [Roseovarius sp. AK1035]|uniref:P-loop NTPase n=2 Tax=Roseovarius sp. TM1035 TaxID=391613 RepID=UPI000319AA3A|nr:SIR2 family protein [Roseovarius sp. TM1035]AWZ21069.1 Hypothetical protein RAK1035_2361 [Roseovarius sp. AK1035]